MSLQWSGRNLGPALQGLTWRWWLSCARTSEVLLLKLTGVTTLELGSLSSLPCPLLWTVGSPSDIAMFSSWLSLSPSSRASNQLPHPSGPGAPPAFPRKHGNVGKISEQRAAIHKRRARVGAVAGWHPPRAAFLASVLVTCRHLDTGDQAL